MTAAVFSHTRFTNPYTSLMYVSYGCHKPSAQTRTVALRTVGAQLRKWSWYHTPRGELWHKRHFGTTTVGICTACSPTFLYGCPHRLCTQIGRYCVTSYSRCSMLRTCMAVRQTNRSTVAQTAFWHTGCTEVYSFLTYVALLVPVQPLYTNWEIL